MLRQTTHLIPCYQHLLLSHYMRLNVLIMLCSLAVPQVYGSGGCHFGMYGAGKDMAWFTVTPTPESKDSWGLIPKERLAEEQARVLAAYKGWGVVEELASRPVAVMVKVGIYDRDPTDTWSKGTVTLAGGSMHVVMFVEQACRQALDCCCSPVTHTNCRVIMNCVQSPTRGILFVYSCTRGQFSITPCAGCTCTLMPKMSARNNMA